MQLIMSLEILTRLHKQVFMSSQLPNKSFNYQTDWTKELELELPRPRTFVSETMEHVLSLARQAGYFVLRIADQGNLDN